MLYCSEEQLNELEARDWPSPLNREEATELYLVVVHLVRNGKSLEVSGAEFTSKFKNEIVGKTVAEFTQMRLLYNIIMELNLIKSISLEASDSDVFSTIFK